MTVKREDIEASFGGRAAPELLSRLVEFQNQSDEAFAGSFEFAAVERDLLETFAVMDDTKTVFGFGINGDGSIFGFWSSDPEAELERAPIAYIDSEGIGSRIIATDFKSFLSLLALDQDDPSCFMSRAEYEAYLSENEDQYSSRHDEFCTFVAEFGIDLDADPNAVMTAAERAHPGFADWLGINEPQSPQPSESSSEGSEESAIERAVEDGDIAAIRRELSQAEPSIAADNPVSRALQHAILLGNVEAIEVFLDSGVAVESCFEDDTTLAMTAAYYATIDSLRFLAERGADFTKNERWQKTLEIVEAQVDEGEDDAVEVLAFLKDQLR